MSPRDDLKALIDQLPETRLEAARGGCSNITSIRQHNIRKQTGCNVSRMSTGSKCFNSFEIPANPAQSAVWVAQPDSVRTMGRRLAGNPSIIGTTKRLCFSHVSSSTDNP